MGNLASLLEAVDIAAQATPPGHATPGGTTFERPPDYRHELTARSDRARFLTIPLRRYLAVDGTDAPGGPAYRAAIGALYPVGYTLHFALRKRGVEAPVGVLEGLYTLGRPSEWSWRLLLPIPDQATDAEVSAAIAEVSAKKGAATVTGLNTQRWEEGNAAQILHIGPYDAEEPTIGRLRAAITDAGLRPRGRHHEIYIGDPNRSSPGRLKTIIRLPVEEDRVASPQ